MDNKRFPTKVKLNAVGIHSGHDLCNLFPAPRIFIYFSPQMTGRGFSPAKYQIVQPGHKTDPESHWSDYGNKTFDVRSGQTKEQALAAAINWANTRYGARTWVRDPFGNYQDERALTCAWVKVKMADREKTEAEGGDTKEDEAG